MKGDVNEYLTLAKSSDPDDRAEAGRQLGSFLVHADAAVVLTELLGDTDWRVRRAAVDSFLQAHLPQNLPLVIDALHDERNAGKRNAALSILSSFGVEIVPLAGPYLRSENPDVRMFFLNILGDLGDATYAKEIMENLDHSNENVVSASILTLGKIGHTESIPRLLSFLQGSNLWLQIQAIEALAELQDPTVIPHLIGLSRSSYCGKTVMKALGRLHHTDSYSALLELSFENDEPQADAMVALLELYRSPQPKILQEQEQQEIRRLAQSHLTESQKSCLLKAATYREGNLPALELLSWLRYEPAIPIFIEAIKRPELAEIAERGLIPFGPESGEQLIATLEEEVEEKSLLTILSLLNHLRVHLPERTVTSLFLHPSGEIRRGAYRNLLKHPQSISVDQLVNGMLQVWPEIYQGCMQALLEHCREYPMEKSEIFRRTKSLTHSENPAYRAHSLEFLVRSGEGDTLFFLNQAWKDIDPQVRKKAVQLMGQFYCPPYKKALISALSDEEDGVREASVRALSQDTSSDVSEALLSMLHDDSVWVRVAVYDYLTSIPGLAHLDLLLQNLQGEHPAAQAVLIRGMKGRGGVAVREILFRFLESEDAEIRKCACFTLGEYPAPETVDRLTRLLKNDTEWEVRNAAVRALALLEPNELSSVLADRLGKDTDPSVRKEILKTMQTRNLESIPFQVFELLIDPDLCDEAYDFLLAKRNLHQNEIAAAATQQKPAVRRILRKLLS